MDDTIDPRDVQAYHRYDRFNRDERPSRDLPPGDRDALHMAAQTHPRWSWGEYVTLAAMVGCMALGTSPLWWPWLQGRW